MAIETPILDGNKGLGEIGRHFAQLHGGAARIAAIGEERAIYAHNGNIGRALGDRQLVNRRQLPGMIDDKPGQADDAPNAQHKGPIEQMTQKGAALPPLAAPIFAGFWLAADRGGGWFRFFIPAPMRMARVRLAADPVMGIYTQVRIPGGGAAQNGFASAANAILSQACLSHPFEEVRSCRGLCLWSRIGPIERLQMS